MKKVVMLDTNKDIIDRRIILEANSLGKSGYQVSIVTVPSSTEKKIILHPNVKIIQLQEEEYININRRFVFWTLYHRFRNHSLFNNSIARKIRSNINAYFMNQIDFYNHYLLELALKENGDIYHAHDLPTLPTASIAAAQNRALLVYDSHELFPEQDYLSRRGQKVWATIEKKWVHKANVVITINKSIADEMASRYGIANVEVIMNCEATNGDMPQKSKKIHLEFSIPQSKKILLFQGGVHHNRNLVNLVKAVSLLKNKDVVLFFLGDGVLIPGLKKLADKEGLTQRVIFKSSVPQKELLSYTISADAGIIPYTATCLNNYYCTPNKLFEFISAGIPILANDLPEIRKIIVGNEIGMVGNFNTAKCIAEGIDSFFSDEGRLEKYRKNLIKVRETYSWGQEEKKLINIYKRLN